MDFISDMATMLKFFLSKSIFMLVMIIIICAEISKSYMPETGKMYQIRNRSNYLVEQWWENSHSLCEFVIAVTVCVPVTGSEWFSIMPVVLYH